MKLLVYLKLKAEGFPQRYLIPCVTHLRLIWAPIELAGELKLG